MNDETRSITLYFLKEFGFICKDKKFVYYGLGELIYEGRDIVRFNYQILARSEFIRENSEKSKGFGEIRDSLKKIDDFISCFENYMAIYLSS